MSTRSTQSTRRADHSSWRARRAERRLYRQIDARPQNVRNELLEMLSRAS